MQRNEPSVGNNIFITAGKFVGIKSKFLDHTKLVDDALDAFTKAEQKMESAIDQIDELILIEKVAIEEANKRVEDAGSSKDKLTRVLDRVRALTA